MATIDEDFTSLEGSDGSNSACLNDIFVGEKPLKEGFENLWSDARRIETELEVLKWMARRKEMEWDCAKLMITRKKNDIKSVKKKINMIRTLHDLGPQLCVDSDDEDTPYEDDDSSDESSQASFIPPQRAFTSIRQKDKSANFVKAGKPHKHSFSKGHLCLQCKSKEPLFVCSECNDHWYCSNSCQEKHWHIHEQNCVKKTVSTSKRPQKRLKMSVEELSKLTKLISDTDSMSKNYELKSIKCLMCKSEEPKFLCSQCKNHWYCSAECQVKHWPEHQKECSM